MALSDLLMNANHLAPKGGHFEPQRQHNALIFIYGLEVYGNAFTKGPIGNVLTLSIESFPIPKTGNEVVELSYLNGTRKVAGRRVVDEIELVLKDFVDQPTAAVCLNWRSQVSDPVNERGGLARDYKKNADIVLYAPNGGFQRRYVLEGVWPSRFDPGDIDHTSSEKVLLNMTLQIDKAYQAESAWGIPLNFPLAQDIGQIASAVAQNLG